MSIAPSPDDAPAGGPAAWTLLPYATDADGNVHNIPTEFCGAEELAARLGRRSVAPTPNTPPSPLDSGRGAVADRSAHPDTGC